MQCLITVEETFDCKDADGVRWTMLDLGNGLYAVAHDASARIFATFECDSREDAVSVWEDIGYELLNPQRGQDVETKIGAVKASIMFSLEDIR